VQCEVPLQAYFRINSENMGQFERTLIIADEGSFVHYVEGCTAPVYSTHSLHSAVVEIIIKKDARARYSTIQNWAPYIYNLVTKRSVVEENGTMEWIDGNIGSKLTMKYPACILKGRGAKGMVLSIAVAGKGQVQDAGAKMIHLAPDTTSTIVSKSISKQGGKVTYRGLSSFGRESSGAKSNIKCDTLILDNLSTSDTIPYNEIRNDNITLEHEATVSKVSEEQLFYLMSRGLTEEEATQMIVMGFIEPFTKELPMEYAVEMNRLIKFEMEGSIG
jgi:Fe-S cluster assembly protein SufB